MDNLVVLSEIQILDIFFRFCAVGILVTLFAEAIIRKPHRGWVSVAFLVVCFISYILLTAPIENKHYGLLRPLFLMFTDLTAYALLSVYWFKVHNRSLYFSLPILPKVAIAGWFIYIGYFFWVTGGRGAFHDVLHLIGLALLLFILFDAIRGFSDDLNEKRRDVRKLVILSVCFYMTMLTLVELLSHNLKDNWLFSLLNALFMMLFSAAVTWHKLFVLPHSTTSVAPSKTVAPNTKDNPSKSPQALKLLEAMSGGLYLQNELTITSLSQTLEVPQHQLRKLINQELGFDNFSHFLNSYRIPHISERLIDPELKSSPILTLALEAGFNSIAPFNRAFKETHGETPSEYRKRHL